MDFKIFKVKGYPDVLVYRHYESDKDGLVHSVRLLAYFADPDEVDHLAPTHFSHSEDIKFENQTAARNFIKDLSQETVEEFLNRFSC